MKKVMLTVISNREIAENVYEMKLSGDQSAITTPGQFVNLKLEGCYLRRPISVCDVDGDNLTLIYKVVGKGTDIMSKITPGTQIDTLSGLGNGFDLSAAGDMPLLIGGGVGTPPMYYLAKTLIKKGVTPQVVIGFNKKEEVFYADEFRALGARTYVATADGSVGTKGFVTDVIKDLKYSYFYACGPLPMFKAVEGMASGKGEYSFEERMGCGFGVCMGCSVMTKNGPKRICKDGPVLKREEVIW